MDLFVYGTLMDPEILQRLTGKRFRSEPARLPGFRRVQQPGTYAYIIASTDECVDGLVLRGVDEETLRALDHYEDEGSLYFRTKVVALTGGESCPCETYVGNVSTIGRLEIT